jgi:hypothetical protein
MDLELYFIDEKYKLFWKTEEVINQLLNPQGVEIQKEESTRDHVFTLDSWSLPCLAWLDCTEEMQSRGDGKY